MKIPVQQAPAGELRTRREFCTYACQAATALAAGTLAACSSSPTSPSTSAPQLSAVSGTVSGRTISIAVDSASALASVGSAASVQTSLGTFLVSRTAQDSFSAVTATCTHEGCAITGFASSQYVCPCHGSRFTTGGAVVNGPATRALQQYATQVANNVLSFTV